MSPTKSIEQVNVSSSEINQAVYNTTVNTYVIKYEIGFMQMFFLVVIALAILGSLTYSLLYYYNNYAVTESDIVKSVEYCMHGGRQKICSLSSDWTACDSSFPDIFDDNLFIEGITIRKKYKKHKPLKITSSDYII